MSASEETIQPTLICHYAVGVSDQPVSIN